VKKLTVPVLIAVLMVFVCAFAYAKDFSVTKKAGEYTCGVTSDKNPPVAGENNLKISIKDSAGMAVKDAKVKVECSMPPMPGMPAMNYKANAVLVGNEYATKLHLSPGPWTISVKITKGGKTETTKFTLDVQ